MPDVMAEQRGHLGLITLDRPKALNALNLDMCEAISAALDDFAANENVAHVAVCSSQNGRYFCAGGDIRAMQVELVQGKYDGAEHFFRTEYMLNRKIARYPKPYISLIDGVVMGGGAGISLHGSHRIASENTVFAMPEVAIGFFPDVGVSRLLAELGAFGAWLAITGARIGAADMLASGVATHHIPATRFSDVLTALTASDDTDDILSRFSEKPATSPAAPMGEINAYFSDTNVIALHQALANNHESAFEKSCLETMAKRSPTSMAIAMRQLHAGVLNIEDTLARDYRIACRVMRQQDFPEGVRALLIDKDNAPRWSPATLNAVNDEMLDAIFAALPPSQELSFA